MTAAATALRASSRRPVYVNDVHSKLNRTAIRDFRRILSHQDIEQALDDARRHALPVAVCGGGHAMGGQQFASGGMLLDTSELNRILDFDSSSGLIEVEAGIQWPGLLQGYLALQGGLQRQWGIRQKQTGADRLSVGGSLSANIHGRVLDHKPLIADVVSFRMICPNGATLECSRDENSELFRLAIGGYGLFGVIVSVTLQLVPRRKLRRIVATAKVSELAARFAQRISDGFVYGDLQFRIDPDAPGFLDEGIFSCYRPVDNDTPIPDGQIYMTESGWQDMLYLAHTDKTRAFEKFSDFYRSTSRQIYWTDTHQFTTYLDDYHTPLDRRLADTHCGSEMITELYVPLDRLDDFMGEARNVLRSTRADTIYGTVRLIRRDDESFLAWAREDFACVIFNLHVEHSEVGIDASRLSFRRLIDAALSHGGSFFLTYHRHATRTQVEAAYPRFRQFLSEKKRRDPDLLLCSDWFRHVDALFDCPD